MQEVQEDLGVLVDPFPSESEVKDVGRKTVTGSSLS